MTETHMYMTIEEARKRVFILTKEIEWIESIIDSKLRQELEIHIDNPPEDVQNNLAKMMSDKLKKRDLFSEAIKYATEHLKIINIDGTTTRWTNNTPAWHEHE